MTDPPLAADAALEASRRAHDLRLGLVADQMDDLQLIVQDGLELRRGPGLPDEAAPRLQLGWSIPLPSGKSRPGNLWAPDDPNRNAAMSS